LLALKRPALLPIVSSTV